MIDLDWIYCAGNQVYYALPSDETLAIFAQQTNRRRSIVAGKSIPSGILSAIGSPHKKISIAAQPLSFSVFRDGLNEKHANRWANVCSVWVISASRVCVLSSCLRRQIVRLASALG